MDHLRQRIRVRVRVRPGIDLEFGLCKCMIDSNTGGSNTKDGWGQGKD